MADYRAGKFKITNNLLKDDWRSLLPLFANMVVVGAQSKFLGWTEYTAFSPMFDVIELGEQAPEYQIEVTRNDDESFSFKAKRIYD